MMMKVNLCKYYILPLIGLNKTSFGGEDNLVRACITQDKEIVVEVKDKTIVPDDNYMDNINYMGDFDTDNTTLIVYKQPDEFTDSILEFAAGRYSKMSQKAKEKIINYGGMNYNKVRTDLPRKADGKYPVDTARLILVLTKDAGLRAKMEADLGAKLAPDAELHDKPTMDEFYPLPE